ncbi:MAG: putative oxidoreductase [Deltaproteobacteria bacterium]|nr:putative oxidoreductase [Deltaproteobacteria bacterium]MBP1775113.1 putative oxidoreductase [candidate division NC10 bacterium]
MNDKNAVSADSSHRPTVLVAYPLVSKAVDEREFSERFPDLELLHVAYELPHEFQTKRIHDPHGFIDSEPRLSKEQAAAFARAEILVTLDAPRDLPAVAPRLRWIQAIGSGISQFGVCGLDRGGIVLTNGAGISSAPISEWVIGRIFSIFKRFDVHGEQQRAHHWEPAYGELIAGKTVIVVGLGAIGCEVAWRCAALGMKVIGIRRTPCQPGEEPKGVERVYPPDRLPDIAGEADVVVSAVPASADTTNLFDASLFAVMAPSCVFINVGRGVSVDEEALAAALRGGRLRAAALDVTRQEPLPPDSPLWDVPNLYLSPHSSPAPNGYMERVWALFLENLEAYRSGRPLRNRVEPPTDAAPA